MAFNAAVVLEVRAGGSDTNGGGFRTGASGTDWSLQDAAQYSVTDAVTNGTTTITSATANFGTDVVGNILYIQGGTASITAGWYEITSRTNSTTIVVDRSTGLTTGTGATLRIGGALASPGGASQALNSGGNTQMCTVYIKYDASPYIITSASLNVSGGCVEGRANVNYVGYDTDRSMYQIFANRPTLQLNTGVSTAIIIAGTNNPSNIQGLILDGNGNTTSSGILNSGEFFYCKAINCTARGMSQNSTGRGAFFCEVANCTFTSLNVGIQQISCYACVVHDCTTTIANTGVFNVAGMYHSCAAYNITTGDGFAAGTYVNCLTYNCVHGFNPHNGWGVAINCIAESNTGYGYRLNAANSGFTIINSASYNNTLGRSVANSGRLRDINPIIGSSSFFNDAPNENFTLNNNADGGALARQTGFPSSMTDLSLTTSPQYVDVGIFQIPIGSVAQIKQFNRGTPY